MNKMSITSAKYCPLQPDVPGVTVSNGKIIKATINGQHLYVPMQVGNRHYDEIMKQVAAGDLTIADAD